MYLKSTSQRIAVLRARIFSFQRNSKVVIHALHLLIVIGLQIIIRKRIEFSLVPTAVFYVGCQIRAVVSCITILRYL